MNIDFKIPEWFTPYDLRRLGFSVSGRSLTRTNFASSAQVIKILKPRHVVFINTNSALKGAELKSYHEILVSNTNPSNIFLYDIAP